MEQYVGDGANLFITIVAVLAAFGAGVAVLDKRKTEKENKAREEEQS